MVNHKKKRYLFTCSGRTISQRSVKQTITITLSNHAEILTLHEASHECVWLMFIIQHVRQTCGLSSREMESTTIYENNNTCIFQLKDILKVTEQKHILPKKISLMIFK